tara:strand:- start:1584 stop:1784 length:201 start_codon:yes stop_codon:yes gene_type:complete
LLLGRKLGGFAPHKPKNSEQFVQEEFYCEMCGRTTKEETILNEKAGKYLCEGCRKEYERKNDGKRS